MSTNPVPLPLDDAFTNPERDEYRRKGEKFGQRDPREGHLTNDAIKYLTQLNDDVASASRNVASASVTTQSAAIAATDLGGSTLGGGLFRVSYYARITRAATTSSSLTVTIRWTDDGVSCSNAFAAITGNTTATHQAPPDSIIVEIDGASPLTYETAYASVGGTTMQYKLAVLVESLVA